MIDSVLKGTGNSRFLKSAVPAGTSWADALAMLQAGTFPIDFNGINTEGFQQVGTPLNKANLLKDATAAQIGLPPSTTPDGMFQALGNTGELHVWRKTVVTKVPVPEVPGSYTLGDAQRLYVATRTFANSNYESYIEGVLASNAITIDLDGKVSLTDPTEVNLYIYNRRDGVTSQTGQEAISGYSYFLIPSTSASFIGCNISMPQDTIYYIPATSNYYRTSSSSGGQSSFDAAQLVTGVPGTPAIPTGTTTTYPVSTNPNAYQEGDDAKAAGYVVGEVETGKFALARGVDYTVRYANNNEVKVNDDGTFSMPYDLPLTGANSSTMLSNSKVVIGRTIQQTTSYGNAYTDFPHGKTYFIPSDATTGSEGSTSDDITNYVTKRQLVTGYAAIPAGTTIEYLGKLGDKARVQMISYVGTGTYGAKNPNSLTFDFIPKAVLIYRPPKESGDYYNIHMFIFYGTNRAMTSTYGNGYNFVTWTGKKVSYYSNDEAVKQMNESGLTYYAIAIS